MWNKALPKHAPHCSPLFRLNIDDATRQVVLLTAAAVACLQSIDMQQCSASIFIINVSVKQEIQVTNQAIGHILTNTNVWSPDGAGLFTTLVPIPPVKGLTVTGSRSWMSRRALSGKSIGHGSACTHESTSQLQVPKSLRTEYQTGLQTTCVRHAVMHPRRMADRRHRCSCFRSLMIESVLRTSLGSNHPRRA